jgi:serine/threonine protein kinase
MRPQIENLIFFNKYKPSKKLGEGSFGKIYLAYNVITKEKYALKLENRNNHQSLLEQEAYILCYLKGEGIPYIKSYGYSGEYNVLVMELLGKSLEQLFEEKGSKLSLKTVCMLGIQMISRLEYIHNKHILHRDIKPDNFIIGIDINCHKVYLIDFGLSKKYRSSRTLQHIKYSENKKLIGTARYASINALAGIEQGRRDDMEALSYVLIYFLRGCLPWQGLRVNKKEDRYKKILEKKKMVNSKELCIGLPNQFYLFVDYCRQLKFDEEPNYEYLKGLLIEIMNNNNFGFDYVYDWSDKKSYNKDLSKSVYKESNNYLKRIQDKKSNEKEKNIENIENYANDRLKTIQEDYNNIDDINNEIGRININQFKFMSNLNKTSNYFGKKILIEENKNEEDKIESKNDGCYII